MAPLSIRRSSIVTTAAVAPNDLAVSIDAIKEECGYSSADTDNDATFRAMILQAQDYVEEAGRTLLRPVVVTERLECFPAYYSPIRLSREPCRSITSVSYVNEAGATIAMDASDYKTWLEHSPPLVAPVGGETWPTTDARELQAVTIVYAAGPTTVADIRPSLLAAVTLIVKATWNNQDGRNREGELAIPQAAKDLIAASARRGYL